jgi:formylglycine-generating enzyme required for sulfatase activity
MGRSDFGNDACPTGSTCGLYEQPEHPVTVSSFALDTFEITVGRFRKFIEFLANNPGWQPAKGAGAHPLIANTGWNQGGWSVVFPGVSELRRQLKCDSNYSVWTDAEGADENRPITCINWYEAFAFCAWDGGRLPTEAEWEYAATGGDDNRPYPWGNQEPDCTYATFYNGYSCAGGSRLTSTVGSTPKGNGRWGQRDLAGNVWEWVLDTASIYSAAEYTDWANLTLGNMRVMRSGDAASIHPGSSWIRSTRRYGYDYATPSATLGSRCAREP